MRRIRKNKYINYILVLIICLSIGYAVLESNLSINGTTNISTVNWDVHFENLIVADSSMPTENPATILSDRTTIEYGINFTSLDQYYLFYVDIVNTGDYDAMLDSISTTANNVSIDNLSDYIDYTIIYTSDQPLRKGDYLKAGSDNREKIMIKIKLKDTVSNNDIAELSNNYNLSIKINYVQADNTATEVIHTKNCTYDGEMVEGATYVHGQYTYKYKYRRAGLMGTEWVKEDDYDGWGVILTDKNSTDPAYGVICSTINNKPIVHTQNMYDYSRAKSIDVSSLNSENVIYGGAMFRGAYAKSINLSKLDTSNMKSMIGMFQHCRTTKLDLSNFDTSNVEFVNDMFWDSYAEELNLSSFNTTNVGGYGMEYMFYGSKASRIDVSSFDTSKITSMLEMFADTTNLEYLNISNFNTSKVTDMRKLFMNSNLKTIDISSFDTTNLLSTAYMFKGCSNLETIYIGSAWNPTKITSNSSLDMFAEATKLPNFDSTVVDITKAHAGTDGYMTLKTE